MRGTYTPSIRVQTTTAPGVVLYIFSYTVYGSEITRENPPLDASQKVVKPISSNSNSSIPEYVYLD